MDLASVSQSVQHHALQTATKSSFKVMNENTRHVGRPWVPRVDLWTRTPFLLSLILSAACCCGSARAELDLTAEFSPTPGLDGFNTYRITATSDLGNIVGFDFSSSGNYGVTGPMNQLNPFGQPTVYQDSMLAGGNPLQDSHFLFNCSDVLTLFPEESATSLHAAFALIGDRQLSIGNSVPFLQLATQSASDIVLKGSLVIRRPNDEYVELNIDTKLSDLTIGAAPNLAVLPIPPPEPVVVPPPVVSPPIQPPHVPEPAPIVQPGPIVVPPVVVPPPAPVPSPIDPIWSAEPIAIPDLPSDPSIIGNFDPMHLAVLRVPYYQNVDLASGVVDKTFTLLGHDELAPINSDLLFYPNDAAHVPVTNLYAWSSAGILSSAAVNSILLDQNQSSLAVPEPTTILIVLIGIAGTAATPTRRKKIRRGALPPNEL
jgi:hypothetical protein